MNATVTKQIIETREKQWTQRETGRFGCPSHDVKRSIRAERYAANFYGKDREYLRVVYRINHVIENTTDSPFDSLSSQNIWTDLDGYTL